MNSRLHVEVAAAARRLARGALRRLTPRAVILMYHRVADLESDPQLLAVRPAHFAEQLEVLASKTQVVRLEELLAALDQRRLAGPTVVITFDDGYADNLSNAVPLLERAATPATVFVTTDYVGRSREFWWDELERLVLQPGRLPQALRFSVNGSTFIWQTEDATDYSEEDCRRQGGWHVEQEGEPGPRQRLYRSLYELLHPLAHPDKWTILDELRQLVGAEPEGRASHRPLSREQLVQLAESELLTVGAHSATHPALAQLPVAHQRAEIRGSTEALEAWLERPIAHFAYPHGSYTDETVTVVDEAGFSGACTSDPAPVTAGSDHLRLPRLVPRDWDGDQFARWLAGWLG